MQGLIMAYRAYSGIIVLLILQLGLLILQLGLLILQLDFIFSSNLRGFKLLNPGLCVPSADTDGDPLWSDDDPVHPLYNGYESIIDTIMKEADSLRPGGKRPGDDINPAAKKPRTEVARPRWIDQPTGSVMHGGYSQYGGQQWFRPGNFGRGRSWGPRRGFRGGRRN
jgi:hypothetical protein